MRRTLLVAAAALFALGGAPAASAAPKPPTVGRLVLVFGLGPTAIDVTIPKGATLVVPKPVRGVAPGFAQMTDQVKWSAVALISRKSRVEGKPVNAVQVHLPMPDHCPATLPPAVPAAPKCLKYVEHTSFHGLAATAAATHTSYALPAGTYQLVIAGEPGRLAAATLLFGGVSRAQPPLYLFAGKKADATLARVRAENVAAAHASGTLPGKLAGTGFGVLGAWHTTAGDEPGEFSYAHCVAAAAVAPEPCPALQAAGQAKYASAAAPPVTTTNSGQVTLQTPLLPAGSYVDAVRVTRAGRGPAAGAFALWLRTDATK